jgi:hypothetical protein
LLFLIPALTSDQCTGSDSNTSRPGYVILYPMPDEAGCITMNLPTLILLFLCLPKERKLKICAY